MKALLPKIDPKKETAKISSFIASALKKTGLAKLVIGLSGGIDSAVSLYLAARSIRPENLIVAHLFYFDPLKDLVQSMVSRLKIPVENRFLLSIKKPVDEINSLLSVPEPQSISDKVRVGNIMARVRMISLFDLAKKNNALVLGTENKSEHLLGYFTRFGDAASDIEPLSHLYKTQVYRLAEYLDVPREIINAKPTAGLWGNQTDESEFGFSYREADQVLYQYFDLKKPLAGINKQDFPNTEKIIRFARKNAFKLAVPYSLMDK